MIIDIRDFKNFSFPKNASVVFTDPPYNLSKNYDNSLDDVPYHVWVQDILDWSIGAKWIIIIGPYPTMNKWLPLIPQPHRILMWHKTFTLPGKKIKEWAYSLSPVLVYKSNDAIYYGKGFNERSEHDCIDAHSMLGDVQRIKRIFGENRPKHPAATGTSFPSKILPLISTVGDLIIDPMAGLGSILVAAARIERNVYGIEISPYYAHIAEQWIMWEINNLHKNGDKNGN